MNTWKVILATLVIFGAGVITGGLLVTYSSNVLRQPRRMMAERPHMQPNPGVGGPRENRTPPTPQNLLLHTNFLDRLDHELKLSPEQHEVIGKIIHDGQERIRELSQPVQRQIHAELVATTEKIRAELTPEQQPRFADLIKRRPFPPRGQTNAPPQLSATNSPRPEP